MNEEDRFETYNELIPFYQDLLPKRQRQILQDYYYENLSLSEIAENRAISRNAVYDALKKGEAALQRYEQTLHLYADYRFRLACYRELNALQSPEVGRIVTKLINKEEEYE